MSKAKVIQPGVYLQGNLGIRRVGEETDYGFEYLSFYPRECGPAGRGCCSDSALRAWGKLISEAEALALIPNMDEQEANLRVQDRQQGQKLAASVLAITSDEALIAELQRRGYTVSRT